MNRKQFLALLCAPLLLKKKPVDYPYKMWVGGVPRFVGSINIEKFVIDGRTFYIRKQKLLEDFHSDPKANGRPYSYYPLIELHPVTSVQAEV